MDNKIKNWERFEKDAKDIFSEVLKDIADLVYYKSKCKLKNRQFDVLIKYKNPLTNSYIAIKCKYWNKRVGFANN